MMKKIKGLYIYIVILFGVSCHNEPYEGDLPIGDDDCLMAMHATAEAAANYVLATEDNISLLCQIYRDALQDQIEICGDVDGALQLLVDGLGSCINENLCEGAILLTEIAYDDYIIASDLDYEEYCNAYKMALIYQIEVCGDDGTLQNLVDELEDCEPVYVETFGTWRLVAWLPDPTSDIDNDGMATDNYLDDIDCYNNETLTFNSNGTGTIFHRSIATITYSPIPGTDQLEFSSTCNDISEDVLFNWAQDGNAITFTLSDGTVLNYFRNANRLYRAVDNGFYATSAIDGTSVITDRVTYVYVKI